MIMPFVKRLKKWINEQALGNQVSKKSKANDSKHLAAAGLIHSNVTMAPLNDRNDVKSPSTVYFKNNAGHRRQRHKSMGDFDSTNVVTHDSTGDTQHPKQESGNKINSGMTNGCPDSNGRQKIQVIDQRSSSPYWSNFQLQPVLSSVNANGNAKQMPSNNLMKVDCNRKKKSAKTQRIANDQNGDDYTLMELQSENDCNNASGRRKWLFNPPKLSQLLCKEPNIANWSNVRLNKDSIMHGSFKLSGK